jgi:hypothetical protein
MPPTLASQVKLHSDMVRREVGEGHSIASHSMTHPDMSLASETTVIKEITDTENLLGVVSGQLWLSYLPHPPQPSTRVCTSPPTAPAKRLSVVRPCGVVDRGQQEHVSPAWMLCRPPPSSAHTHPPSHLSAPLLPHTLRGTGYMPSPQDLPAAVWVPDGRPAGPGAGNGVLGCQLEPRQ